MLVSSFLLLTSAVGAYSSYLTPKTEEYAVNGTSLPDVDFDIGESYAGYLSNRPSGDSNLYFWFFPSTNPDASEEITIWLNGGPGCTSLAGLLQEHGPFLWQPGTSVPFQNPYSWNNLTNIVYVDQPAGTGLSLGPATVWDEDDVANQFIDFWKRFVDTFDLKDRKVYITGESYAGMYIPYLASAMLDKEDSEYFDVSGVLLYDPLFNERNSQVNPPAVPMVNYFKPVLGLNNTFMDQINSRHKDCGYEDFMDQALQFPPTDTLPPAPSADRPGCDIWTDILDAATYVNPCFNIYHITDYCPVLWNVLGFPSTDAGPSNYFNRSDVQKAINSQPIDFHACSLGNIFQGEDNLDQSIPSALGPLPSVIERTNNTIIGHGLLDFVLIANGSLAAIQNMTWNGLQGFQEPPTEPLFAPYHPFYGKASRTDLDADKPLTHDAGAGFLGTAHTERGLTYTTVDLAGHQVPQYSPGTAFRHLEFLLGRIDSLSEITKTFSSGLG
ncbi:hypothetical protein N8T08_009893 [Aspergillus melleus]|uniref:Uncharacterized protein n=1 Tax=Aspergillus melleus TaxID=138277 RepID=A0ACC3ASK2_9EURO|nr:hypothetical protein N8T08_009893 [Aspergillus melleus]